MKVRAFVHILGAKTVFLYYVLIDALITLYYEYSVSSMVLQITVRNGLVCHKQVRGSNLALKRGKSFHIASFLGENCYIAILSGRGGAVRRKRHYITPVQITTNVTIKLINIYAFARLYILIRIKVYVISSPRSTSRYVFKLLCIQYSL